MSTIEPQPPYMVGLTWFRHMANPAAAFRGVVQFRMDAFHFHRAIRLAVGPMPLRDAHISAPRPRHYTPHHQAGKSMSLKFYTIRLPLPRTGPPIFFTQWIPKTDVINHEFSPFKKKP